MQRRFICRCAAGCEFSRQARRGPGTHAQRPRRSAASAAYDFRRFTRRKSIHSIGVPGGAQRRWGNSFHAEKEAPCARAGAARDKVPLGCGRVGRKQAKRRHLLDFKQRTQDESPPSDAAAPPPPTGEARDEGYPPKSVMLGCARDMRQKSPYCLLRMAPSPKEENRGRFFVLASPLGGGGAAAPEGGSRPSLSV